MGEVHLMSAVELSFQGLDAECSEGTDWEEAQEKEVCKMYIAQLKCRQDWEDFWECERARRRERQQRVVEKLAEAAEVCQVYGPRCQAEEKEPVQIVEADLCLAFPYCQVSDGEASSFDLDFELREAITFKGFI